MYIYDKLNEEVLKNIDKVKIGEIIKEVMEALLKAQVTHKSNQAEAVIVCGQISEMMLEMGESILKCWPTSAPEQIMK